MGNNNLTGSLGNILGSPATHGNYPHYETPVVADFNDLQFKMNVLARKWCQENYPEGLLVLYEFQGWYKQQDPDEGMVSIILDEDHGMPDSHSCRGVYTVLMHDEPSYSNIITIFTYFSDSNLDSLYIEEWDSPFLESGFPGDWPSHEAGMALDALRAEKKNLDYFTEGWVTYRKGIDWGMSEPRYQFTAEGVDDDDEGTFDTVGVNTMRVNVPPEYDETIPHTPYPGIDDVPEPSPVPEEDVPEDAERPGKVPFNSFDFNGDGKTSYGEYLNMHGWQK